MIGHFPYDINVVEYLNKGTTLEGLNRDPINGRIAVVRGLNKVAIFDSNFDLIIEVDIPTRPIGIGFDEVNNRWFVMDDEAQSGGKVYIIDGVNYSVSPDNPEFIGDVCRAVVFDNGNDRMFMSSFWSDYVMIHKVSDLSRITTISVLNPVGLHLDVSNNRLYVGCHLDKVVRVYNTTTYALTQTINGATGNVTVSEFYNLQVDDQNSDLLLSNDRVEKTIVVIRKSTGVILGKMQLGQPCLYFFPLGSKIYVTFYSTDKIGVINKFYS